ncbi:hypothetical protein SLEP1_g34410 [Rubroshorea leprosula]|uniref:Uncharacterized protein n=1 Tax=Rubroshorea leprosula TaxID=152421 RepID=A0AAV5KJR1_9ROSI|nr:hypothetical protein SLEP1_g34410 [Rubroshorea leprosula]
MQVEEVEEGGAGQKSGGFWEPSGGLSKSHRQGKKTWLGQCHVVSKIGIMELGPFNFY